MTFTLTVSTQDELLGQTTLKCGSSSNCYIKYKRYYTPVIHELSPPVVYKDSETLLYFDPRSITGLIQDLDTDEMPFINAKIGNVLMDFENSVDFDAYFS
jgi:hypothetical protein